LQESEKYESIVAERQQLKRYVDYVPKRASTERQFNNQLLRNLLNMRTIL